MSGRRLGIAAFLSVFTVVGCSATRDREALTFTQDVAPILFEHCAGCHRPGQVAPFSVLDYQTVKPYAQRMAAATARHVMPPWPPEHGYGDFKNERRLSDAQIELIQRWVELGAPEGDAARLPPAPRWSGDWQLGTPDLVVTLPEAYTLPAGGSDVFRNFILPVDSLSTRYVRGLEFRPGNTRVVHHATVLINPGRASRRMDAEDPVPGYEGMLGFAEGVHAPDGHLLGWTPGRAPALADNQKTWRLEARSDLVVQLHMLPQATPQAVQPTIGLFFGDPPPADVQTPVRIRLGSHTIDIPAGVANHTITDSYRLPVDADVLTINPHAHYLARDIKGFATLPDGTRRWLIWIRDWNFNWQDVYEYSTPVRLPRGTTLTMEFSYDNSARNPRQRQSPPQRVVYGPRSTDEMGDLWLQLLPLLPADRALLVRDYGDRAAAEAVREAELRLRETPDAERHNLLGVRYIEAGRLQEAETALRQALRLRPGYIRARANFGTVLQAQGKIAEAIDQYRRALMLEPDSFDLQLKLGTALNTAGRFRDAVAPLEASLLLDADSPEAHNNLAVALGSLGRVEEAIRHFRRAIELKSDYADAEANLGAALDLAGAREDALRHVRRALDLQPDHADAQRHLARLEGR